MFAYLVVAVALLILALISMHSPTKWAAIASTVIVGLFVGLRYHLGYDWLAYDSLFSHLREWHFGYQPPAPVLQVEPLFLWLNILTKSLGGSVDILFAVIAVFNVWAIYFVVQRICPNSQPIVWLVYFCVAVVTVQMNTTRQAFASSFVLLGLLFVANRKTFTGATPMIAALGIQVSSAMFAPLWLINRVRFSGKIIAFALAIFVASFAASLLTGLNLFHTVIRAVMPFSPDWLRYKLCFHLTYLPVNASISAMVLIVWHSIILTALFKQRNDDPFIKIGFALTLYMLAAHLMLSHYPTFWTRIMAVALPWQTAAALRADVLSIYRLRVRQAVVAGVGIAGIAGLGVQLHKPDYFPFLPYHTILQAKLMGDEGYGFERTYNTICARDGCPLAVNVNPRLNTISVQPTASLISPASTIEQIPVFERKDRRPLGKCEK
jgi:hypothetical protein